MSQRKSTLPQLVRDINRGRVKTLSSSDNTLKATYYDGTIKTVDLNADGDVASMLLEWNGADSDTVREILVAQPHSSGSSLLNWLAVLGAVLPILVVAGTVYILFRPMSLTALHQSPARTYRPEVKFGDLGGVDAAVSELRSVLALLKAPDRLAQQDLRLPHLLLTGDPGTGKSLLAQAAGGEAGITFFETSGAEFIELFSGIAAGRMKDLFLQAEKSRPCILFIDELDALGSYRSPNNGTPDDERQHALDSLCLELDRVTLSPSILVIAATNRPDLLDPALLRSGRFERQIHLDRPDAAGRERILQLHARTRVLNSSVDLAQIAAATGGFVGADLARLVNEAAVFAAQAQRPALVQADFEQAIPLVAQSVLPESRPAA